MCYNSDIHHRRTIRLRGYDYSWVGAYFITICIRNGKHLFGHIVDGKMILNEYGIIAHNEWLKTHNIRSNVQLGEFIVMPNHVHGIIVITDNITVPRRGVLHTPPPTVVTNAGKGVCNTPLRSPSQTVGAIIRGYKTAVTKQLNQLACFGSVFQRNYHEHIIRNHRTHHHIATYITNNPINWENDEYKN